MLSHFDAYLRTSRDLYGYALFSPLALILIQLFPKDYAPADPFRLTLTICFFVVLAISIIGIASSYELWLKASDRWHFGAISPAIDDTLSFLQFERSYAKKGLVPIAVGLVIGLLVYVLSFWPQLTILAPFRDIIIALAPVTPLLPIFGLVQNRGHLVNAYFLRRYLKEQMQRIDARPRLVADGERLRTTLKGPAIVQTGPHGFRAGGFDWELDDFYKNAVVFGQPGSGKTVCVLNSLLEGLFVSTNGTDLPISGLILDPKGDFRDKIARLCHRMDRQDDLFILDPDTWNVAGRTRNSIAWNPLDNDDDPLEITERLIATLKILGSGRSGNSYFISAAKTFIRHAITLLKAATPHDPPSLVDVHRLCTEDPDNPPLYATLMRELAARYPGTPGPELPTAVDEAIRFFAEEWVQMPIGQLAGVRGSVTELLDEFLIEPFRHMFSGRTTLPIAEAIESGKIIYVHMPIARYDRMAPVVITLFKLEFQRQVLQRPNKRRPSFFLCDEFQVFYTSGEGKGDSDFFERSRQSNHANIIAAQNLSSFYKRSRTRTAADSDVTNFLGLCSVAIFLRNTEKGTNLWASGLFQRRSEIVVTSNEVADINRGFGRRRFTSYSKSTREVPVVPPEAFTYAAIPDRSNPDHYYTESIVYLASRAKLSCERLFWQVHPLE